MKLNALDWVVIVAVVVVVICLGARYLAERKSVPDIE